jgi:hypothetical protein
MVETLKFVYIVMLFVSLFIVVVVGKQTKLVIIIYFYLFYAQFFTLLVIILYSYFKIKEIVILTKNAIKIFQMMPRDHWRALKVIVKGFGSSQPSEKGRAIRPALSLIFLHRPGLKKMIGPYRADPLSLSFSWFVMG